jgi:hypothetical protein
MSTKIKSEHALKYWMTQHDVINSFPKTIDIAFPKFGKGKYMFKLYKVVIADREAAKREGKFFNANNKNKYYIHIIKRSPKESSYTGYGIYYQEK